MNRRRRLGLVAVLVAASTILACSGGDGNGSGSSSGASEPERVRFCDAYLLFLAEPTAPQLDGLAQSAEGDLLALIESVASAADPAVAGIDPELDDVARERCQVEWTAGAQGAGNTPGAAEAFLTAVVAGDRVGARNVAAANAIAVFEPWAPVEGDASIVDVGDRSFALETGARTATCQVDAGVVLACRWDR